MPDEDDGCCAWGCFLISLPIVVGLFVGVGILFVGFGWIFSGPVVGVLCFIAWLVWAVFSIRKVYQKPTREEKWANLLQALWNWFGG